MKILFLAFLLSIPGFAQARPTTFRMTCAQAQALVKARGSVVMNYAYSPRAGWLYERFVASSNECEPQDVLQWLSVKSSDTPKCHLDICSSDPFSR